MIWKFGDGNRCTNSIASRAVLIKLVSAGASGSKQIVAVGYVAAAGRLLLREDVLLNPNPNFTVVRLTRNNAESSYSYGLRIATQ